MEIYISDQLSALLAFGIFGAISGLVYDSVRTVRSFMLREDACGKGKIVAGKILDFILDILYMTFVGCSFAVLSYCYSYGKLRSFDVVSFAFCFWLYKKSLGRLYALAVAPAVRVLKNFLYFVLRLSVKPLLLFFKLIVSFMHWVYSLTVSRLVLKIRRTREDARFEKVLSLLETEVRF